MHKDPVQGVRKGAEREGHLETWEPLMGLWTALGLQGSLKDCHHGYLGPQVKRGKWSMDSGQTSWFSATCTV
jgi:hypothetical protein